MPTATRTFARVAGSKRNEGGALQHATDSKATAAPTPAVLPRFLQVQRAEVGLGDARDKVSVPITSRRSMPRYLQAKLEISQPGDAYEQEADQVAEQVMRMPDRTMRQPYASEVGTKVQRKADAPVNTPPASDAANLRVQTGAGRALDQQTRDFFEPRFGQDFSAVRVHAGADAETSARNVNARAYTLGQDVIFAAGEFAPATQAGRQLLAHELAHVVQQSDSVRTMLQRQEDRQETSSNAQTIPYFVEFSIKGDWNADEVLRNLQLLTAVPEDLAAAIRAGPRKAASYCAQLLGILKVQAASNVSADANLEKVSSTLLSRWNELYHATRNSPLRYSDLAQVAQWGSAFSPPEPTEALAVTNNEPLVQVPVQNVVDWNEQYAAAYRKKRPKGDSAEKDFETERSSGKVKRASSIAGIRVKTRLSSDQVHRIIVAGGEKASADRCAAMADKISEAFETMLIDTAQAQADYLAHLAGETGGVLEEVQGDKRSYAPFQGRGAVQITGPEIYAKALGTLQQRRDQIAAQLAAMTAKAEADSLRQQLIQLDEAINAIRADPKAAADPRYAFLLSAANMHKTGAVGATSRLGATAVFAGNGPADTWVSGGNKGMTFDERKIENEAELVEWKKNLDAEKQKLASETDPEAAKPLKENIKRLQAGVDARKTLIQDMTSAKSRARIKAAVYAAGVRILSAENSVDTGPKVGP